jgi:putative transcriptional regulator
MSSYKGHFLLARPYLTDPNFHHTVVLVIEHSSEGAAGVVINRPTDTTIERISKEAFEEQYDWEKPIGLGGPVAGPLMALHQRADLADHEVLAGVYHTTDATKLTLLAHGRVEPSRFLANYAGWGPGQLENEMAEASWLSLPATAESVFRDDVSELWQELSQRVRADHLASMVGLDDPPADPRVN